MYISTYREREFYYIQIIIHIIYIVYIYCKYYATTYVF